MGFINSAGKGIRMRPSLIKIMVGDDKVMLIDGRDHQRIKHLKWHLHSSGYICRAVWRENNRKQGCVFLHREVLPCPEGKVVDHINGNKLDNRRHNLRLATHSQNCANSVIRQDNTSGYIGVSAVSNSNKWRAYVRNNGKPLYLGLFNSKEEAATTRDKKALELFGEYAKLNFKESVGK